MIHASCRQNFTSTTFLAPLQLRISDTGEAITKGQLQDMLAGRQVDIFVHGYRNEFEGAANAYNTLSTQLDGKGMTDSARIGFFWPGSWARVGFSMAVARAKRAGLELAELIDYLKLAGCKVTVETHSLGARVALCALKEGPSVDCLILTAPAVDYDSLALSGEFQNAVYKAGKFTVMHSKRDSVLKFAYRALNWFTPALGLVGPESPKPLRVAVRDMTAVVDNHGAYKDVDAVFDPSYWRA